MNRLKRALSEISIQLTALDARFALVGGLAVSARAEPRFTRDVDLAVSIENDKAGELLIRELTGKGYRTLVLVEQDTADRLATVRLGSVSEGSEGVVVDLLFASSGIEPDIVQSAEEIEILDGLVLPIATTGHLIALKVLSRDDQSRPQDAADLKALLSIACDADLQLARRSVQEITRRGFHRGRDLIALLDQAMEQTQSPS